LGSIAATNHNPTLRYPMSTTRFAAGIFALSLFFSVSAHAQKDSSFTNKTFPMDKSALGVGLGLDYGGIGANVTIYPQRSIGFFGGIGYTVAGLGFNIGFKARFSLWNTRPSPSIFVAGMYGYNTAYTSGPERSKFFYGPTVGAGLETTVRPHRIGVWAFAILLPIRSGEALKYDPLPVAFSIGYKFIVR
jgi:hypothetical protein